VRRYKVRVAASGKDPDEPDCAGDRPVHGDSPRRIQLEISGFRNHKSLVNIPGVCGVKEMNGEKPSRYLNGKHGGAEYEKHERAIPALSGRQVARTGFRDARSCNQIQSHHREWKTLRVRRDVVTSRSARVVFLQARRRHVERIPAHCQEAEVNYRAPSRAAGHRQLLMTVTGSPPSSRRSGFNLASGWCTAPGSRLENRLAALALVMPHTGIDVHRSPFLCPHAGQVMVDSSTTVFITVLCLTLNELPDTARFMTIPTDHTEASHAMT
jgi:hypothetical protein